MSGCGTCTMCCKTMGVAALDKPRHSWCQHADPSRGCRVYDDRPQECRDFTCLYLAMHEAGQPWPLSLRPDNSKVIFTFASEDHTLSVHCDRGHEDKVKEASIVAVIAAALDRDGKVNLVK